MTAGLSRQEHGGNADIRNCVFRAFRKYEIRYKTAERVFQRERRATKQMTRMHPQFAKYENAQAQPSRSSVNDLTVRRAGVQDATRIAALFHLVYRDSNHPFQTVDDVAAFLSNPNNFEIVAEEKGQIVSSMAMTHYEWNNSYELGRALTHPAYRRNGIAATLMRQVVAWVCQEARGDVFFGYPRVRRIVELCAVLDPAMIVAGHDGGR